MVNLVVNDLERHTALDPQTGATLIGGGNQAAQGIANGGVFGLAVVQGGGILSPTINIQTIVSTPINVQLTNILEQIQVIDVTNIIASVVSLVNPQ